MQKNQERAYLWRLLFVAGGLLVMAGGPQHPGGTMHEMLTHPAWFRAHALIFVGFLAWTVGLWLFHRMYSVPASLNRWLLIGIVMIGVQTLDMAVHTMAYVDAEALAAGAVTPVLTAHLVLTVVVYPVFALAMIGMIWAGQRKRWLGSPWFGWIGMLGAASHGAAGLLVVGFNVGWARMLFPLLLLLAIWFILVGVWPLRPATSATARLASPVTTERAPKLKAAGNL